MAAYGRALVCAAALVVLAGCARLVGARTDQLRRAAPGSTTFHALRAAGRTRTFLLHLPPSARGSQRLPLVIVLHGSDGNANVIMDESRLNARADSAGYAVAYPNGSGWLRYFLLTWNSGRCCGDALAFGVDDVTFIRDLVAAIASALPIDRTRVYLAGFSDGGRMAFRMACSDARMFAGVASISGALPDTTCAPAAPISIDMIHGTADRRIRFGAPSRWHRRHGQPPATVPQTFAWWAQRDHCQGPPSETRRDSIVTEDYVHCAAGVEVELHTVLGGQHAWPGGRREWFLAPKPTAELDASSQILGFFSRHRRPEADSTFTQ